MSKIEWICDHCFYNWGQYCGNDKYAYNYENCGECDGFVKNTDEPGEFDPDDLGIGQDEPDSL